MSSYSTALWKRDPQAAGSGCFIPIELAMCPGCGGQLVASCNAHHADTGQPIASAIDFYCAKLPEWKQCASVVSQSTWQPIRDKVHEWCNADTEVR